MFVSQIFNKSGGYRRLHSFNLATIVHLGTMSFCKRFIDWKADPLGASQVASPTTQEAP